MQISHQKYSELLNGEGLRCGSQVLRLAKSEDDRKRVFRLRYEIFNLELKEGLKESEATGLDQDFYDNFCDHLMILQGERVIGTYRLLSGLRRPDRGFYSEEEFDLSGLNIQTERSVELGRGCIDPEYRKQSTLMNLLFGLSVYMEIKNAQYLFGCGSLPLMSADDAEATYQKLLEMDKIVNIPGVSPRPTHDFRGDASKGTPQIPPLVEVYLAFGAQIIGRPAYDAAFGCYDLFVFIDKEKRTEWGVQILDRFDRRIQERNEQEQT